MSRSVVLTPFSYGEIVLAGSNGSRWRKLLLPVGSINYRGRKLNFTKEYLSEIVRAFHDGAVDQVPFQLADANNKHNNDPERTRGSVVGLEQGDDGLYAIVETTKAGSAVLEANPKLGVSARIYENYQRESDGKGWVAALQHVLGTLDPHITGMGPWQKLEPASLSNPSEEETVLDLSEETIVVEKEGTMDNDSSVIDDLLSDPELDETELTDAELDELIAFAEAQDDDDSGSEPEGDPAPSTKDVQMTGPNQDALELANAQIAQQAAELARVSSVLDAQQFSSERDLFAREYGIPPRIVDLARPLLEGSGHVVELSGGDQIDAGAVVRNVLTAIGKTVKLLDLSGLLGRSEDPTSEEEAAEFARQEEETRDFVKLARNQGGL